MLTADLIAQLHCPWCGSDLQIDPGSPGGRAPRSTGLLRLAALWCDCCRYPVIDGIPIILQGASFPDPWREQAVAAALRADRPAALHAAMRSCDLVSRGKLKVAAARACKWISPRLGERYGAAVDPRAVLDDHLTFEEMALALRPWDFAHYLIQRYANPSLLAAIPLILLIGTLDHADGRDRPRVIDLGAGAGHASALIASLIPGVEVVTTDRDFVSLCLARRLLGDAATLIALDAEVPLPFPDRWADAVFSLDAYHYMRSKIEAAAELARVVSPAGLWLFSHLHNARGRNMTPGYPLSPEGYARCFHAIDARLFDEAALLRRFMHDGAVDLSEASSPADLEHADALCMIGSAHAPPWRRHDRLGDAYFGRHAALALNPIYRLDGPPNEHLHLRRVWGTPRLQRECSRAEQFLPEILELDADLLRRAETGAWDARDDAVIAELVRSFVLVPLPRGYRRPGRAGAVSRSGVASTDR